MSTVCTVCEHPSHDGGRLYSSILLGVEDAAICYFCFQAWFDGGLVEQDAVCADSLERRKKWLAKQTPARECAPHPTPSSDHPNP